MLRFFDLVFYSIYKWYHNNKESGSEGSAIAAVAGFQSFNVLSAIWSLNIFFNEGKFFISKPFLIALYAGLFILNYIRNIQMRKFDKDSIAIQWDKKSPDSQKEFRDYLRIYISLTIALFFGLIIYSARHKMKG